MIGNTQICCQTNIIQKTKYKNNINILGKITIKILKEMILSAMQWINATYQLVANVKKDARESMWKTCAKLSFFLLPFFHWPIPAFKTSSHKNALITNPKIFDQLSE